MADPVLVIEDGTVVSGANTYIDMTYMDAHCSARGNADWEAGLASPDNARVSAVIRAFVYIEGKYGHRMPGVKIQGRNQSASWPRKNAIDRNGDRISSAEIPSEIKIAQAEAAYREFLTPGYLTPDYVASEHIVSETLGPISTTYASSSGGAAHVTPVVQSIEDALLSLIGVSSSSTFVSPVVRS